MILLMTALLVTGCKSDPTAPVTAAGNLQFQVQDKSGNALWGAKVVSESEPVGQLKVTGITDDQGIVNFDNIAAGEYSFYISRFDYLPTEVAMTVITGQIQVISVQLMLEASPTTIPADPIEVTFSDLALQPQIYSDKFVCIDGYWFDGFEIAVLAERLDPSSYKPGNLEPGGILIWIKGGLSEAVREQLYLQPENVTGYPAHYGKVRLAGRLEYGGEYGHLNSYQYQLNVYASESVPWNPNQDAGVSF